MTVKRKELIIDLLLGLAIVVFCYFNSTKADASALHRILDGCFASGVLLTGFGTIIFCSNKGTFNIFGFGIRYSMFALRIIKDRDRETYYDYCMRKAEKEPKSFLSLLISGGVYIALSLVLLVIYLQV